MKTKKFLSLPIKKASAIFLSLIMLAGLSPLALATDIDSPVEEEILDDDVVEVDTEPGTGSFSEYFSYMPRTKINDKTIVSIDGKNFKYSDIKYSKSSPSKISSAAQESVKPYSTLETVGSYAELLRFFDEQGLFYEANQAKLYFENPSEYWKQFSPSGEYYDGDDVVVEEATDESIPEPEPEATAEPQTLEEGTEAEDEAVDDAAPSDTPAPGAATTVPGHSETNTQVSGVDEGDVIKTDGKYIYWANIYKSYVDIISASGKEMNQVSRISLDKEKLPSGDKTKDISFSQMYVKGDRLVIVAVRKTACAHSMSQRWSNGSHYSSVYFVYDISNPAKPSLARSVEISGINKDTRMVDNQLVFVVDKGIHPLAYDGNLSSTDMVPYYSDSRINQGEKKYVAPKNISILPGRLSAHYTIIGSFDVTKNDSVKPEVFLGSNSGMYMNSQRLYLSREGYDSNMNSSVSNLYRFNIANNKIEFTSAGKVNGYILNQYSMDEYNGNLRIATTSRDKKYRNVNNLYVLNRDMKTVGSLENLAPTETIRSVRFSKNTAYVVTYEILDPLFVIDLRTPERPNVLGELKIPGFSQYLHQVADGYLIGIGRDTEVLSHGGVVDNGMKISMFNVKNPRNPKEIFTMKLDANQSIVTSNPRALMLDRNKNLIAFPVYDYDSGKYVGGTYVISYSTSKGFDMKAELEATGTMNDIANSRTCYIGDTLYMAYGSTLTAYNYGDFTELATLKLS